MGEVEENTQQTVKEVRNQRDSSGRNFIKALDGKLLVILVAIILLCVWAVQAKVLTTQQLIWILVTVVIVILLIAYKNFTKARWLTYEQAFAIALNHLQVRQKLMLDVPDGAIQPIGEGRLRLVDNEPHDWTFGFIIRGLDSFESVWELIVDAHVDGIGVIGRISRQEQGYDPYQRKDLFLKQYDTTFLPPGVKQGEPRR